MKALTSARDRALADNSARRGGHDVLALSGGAEETTQDMGAVQKVRHLLQELGGLLPFFADNDGEALRGLVAATLAWLQKAEGTVVEVNSQGEAETQQVNATSHNLFGGTSHNDQPGTADTVPQPENDTVVVTLEAGGQALWPPSRGGTLAAEVLGLTCSRGGGGGHHPATTFRRVPSLKRTPQR